VFQVDEEAEGLHSILNTYATTTSADLPVYNKLGGGAANKLTTSRANGPPDNTMLGGNKLSTSSNETH